MQVHSYQQLTVCGVNHIHEQYLSGMQTLFDTRNVHAQGTMYIIVSLLYTSGIQRNRVKINCEYDFCPLP